MTTNDADKRSVGTKGGHEESSYIHIRKESTSRLICMCISTNQQYPEISKSTHSFSSTRQSVRNDVWRQEDSVARRISWSSNCFFITHQSPALMYRCAPTQSNPLCDILCRPLIANAHLSYMTHWDVTKSIAWACPLFRLSGQNPHPSHIFNRISLSRLPPVPNGRPMQGS